MTEEREEVEQFDLLEWRRCTIPGKIRKVWN